MNEDHDTQEYDRSNIMFSPSGELLQVSYARKSIERGATTVGVRTNHGIALVVEKVNGGKLAVPESFKKIFLIDDHIGVATAGLISDAEVLIDIARFEAQRNFASYDEPIDVNTLTKKICYHMQSYTQYSGMRPYGTALLVAGYDKDGQPRLFETDPSGSMFEYKATAIGSNAEASIGIMENLYEDDMDLDDGVLLAILSLHNSGEKTFNPKQIEIGVIEEDTKMFKKLSVEEVKKYSEMIKEMVKEEGTNE